jgi:HlyD family secretion protein
MQILASVDESDIGSIHEGQEVRFSVQAYPNQKFTGKVKQVRLQSKTTENVVNYTVVVLVGNNDGKLLPGMTATLEFLTGTVNDALLVPNSALRFRPTDEMRAQVMKRMQAQRAAANGSQGAGGGEGAAGGAGGDGAGFGNRSGAGGGTGAGSGGGVGSGASGALGFGAPNGSGGFAGAPGAGGRFRNGQPPPMLWYLDESGQLTMTRVRAGLTDGQKTAVESPRIKEGMQVIIGVNQPTQATQGMGTPFGGPPGGGQFQRRPGF